MKQRWTSQATIEPCCGATTGQSHHLSCESVPLDELLQPYVARRVPRRMTQRRIRALSWARLSRTARQSR